MYQYEIVADKGEDYNIAIINTNNSEEAQKAAKWAKDKGYANVRISDLNNLEKPNFINTLNKLK